MIKYRWFISWSSRQEQHHEDNTFSAILCKCYWWVQFSFNDFKLKYSSNLNGNLYTILCNTVSLSVFYSSWNCAQAKTNFLELQKKIPGGAVTYYALTLNSWSYLVGALAIGYICISWCLRKFDRKRSIIILVDITTLANWIIIFKQSLDHSSIFCLYMTSLFSMGTACITTLISLSEISSHRYLIFFI